MYSNDRFKNITALEVLQTIPNKEHRLYLADLMRYNEEKISALKTITNDLTLVIRKKGDTIHWRNVQIADLKQRIDFLERKLEEKGVYFPGGRTYSLKSMEKTGMADRENEG